MKKISYIFASILLTASLSGCNDFLDVTPSDQYSDASVFTSTEGAQQVLIGAYDWFTNGHYAHYTNQYIFFMPDVMADDAMVTVQVTIIVLFHLINTLLLQAVLILWILGLVAIA